MRGAPEVTALVTVLLMSMATLAGAEEAAPAAPAPPSSLFQSLSLGSGKGPVRIDSDSLELDYKSSNITYRGHVQVTQGDITLKSDRLSITYDPAAVKRETGTGGEKPAKASRGNDQERIKQIIAEGNVRIQQGTRLAEGGRAVFDQAKQTVVLSDGAILHEGMNQVAGERVIVFLKEERSVVEGGSNTRVKAVLYPGKDDAAAKATALPIQAADSPAAGRP